MLSFVIQSFKTGYSNLQSYSILNNFSVIVSGKRNHRQAIPSMLLFSSLIPYHIYRISYSYSEMTRPDNVPSEMQNSPYNKKNMTPHGDLLYSTNVNYMCVYIHTPLVYRYFVLRNFQIHLALNLNCTISWLLAAKWQNIQRATLETAWYYIILLYYITLLNYIPLYTHSEISVDFQLI